MHLSLTSVFIFDECWRSEAQKPTPGSSRNATSPTAPPFKTSCMTICKCEGSRRFYWHQRWSARLLRGHRREAELFQQAAEVNHLNQHSCAANGKQKNNLFRVHRFFSSVQHSLFSLNPFIYSSFSRDSEPDTGALQSISTHRAASEPAFWLLSRASSTHPV